MKKYSTIILFIFHILAIIYFAVHNEGNTATFLLVLTVFYGVKKESKKIKWKTYFLFGTVAFFTFILLSRSWYPLWEKLITWEVIDDPHWFHWDQTFEKIPFNDGSLFRVFQTPALTQFFSWIYLYGYVLCVVIALLRVYIIKDFKGIYRYGLSSHFTQVPIAFIFYATVKVDEVWFVKQDPDRLHRHYSSFQTLTMVQDCFPSLHTSISFAIILHSLKEENSLFKWVKIVYATLIIYSTFYLEIHWVIDVIAGIIYGYIFTKIANFILKDKKDAN